MQIWEKRRVPHGFWKAKENRIDYLLWLGNKLGFSTFKDW